MKFGVLASHQFPFEDDLSLRLKELFSLTQLAADRGYDSVFTINHFLANLQTPQVISMTASMLEYSGSMQVGTSILLLPFFHPVHIAEEFATLDQLSGGRMILGVGAGYRDVEFDTFGIDKKRRGARLAECVDVIRKMWTGEPVHHDGEFYKLDGVSSGVRPLQAGGPGLQCRPYPSRGMDQCGVLRRLAGAGADGTIAGGLDHLRRAAAGTRSAPQGLCRGGAASRAAGAVPVLHVARDPTVCRWRATGRGL